MKLLTAAQAAVIVLVCANVAEARPAHRHHGSEAHRYHARDHHGRHHRRHARVARSEESSESDCFFCGGSSNVVRRTVRTVGEFGRAVLGGRPRAWCGWYHRQQVGVDPGPRFNLARAWAGWGVNAGGPGVGVTVVWPHHVGMVTGRAPDGRWIVKSGNDSNMVRERPRSLAGAISFRRPA